MTVRFDLYFKFISMCFDYSVGAVVAFFIFHFRFRCLEFKVVCDNDTATMIMLMTMTIPGITTLLCVFCVITASFCSSHANILRLMANSIVWGQLIVS